MESDYSDETSKRRRSGSKYEDEEIFGRSKRTARTPAKHSTNNEEKLDKILSLMQDMTKEIQDMKKEMKDMRLEQKEFSEEIRIIKKENEELKKHYQNSKKENEEIKKELNDIKKNLEWYEKENRKNNIVITGLKVEKTDTENLKEELNTFIQNQLGVLVQAKMATKLSEKTYKMELRSEEDKENIMKNKYKLKNMKEDRIYISHDLSKRERYMKQQIRTRALEERNKGKEVRIGYSKLIINGVEWRWNKNTECLEKTKN